MYHGWDDSAIPAGNTLNYYAAMRQASGKQAATQTRLFMVPGMAHCGGGNGPNLIDYLAELEHWDSTGVAPDEVMATQPDDSVKAMMGLPTKPLRSRPICAWPRVALYKGRDSIDKPESFSCL
jgi:feruloyl esterase